MEGMSERAVLVLTTVGSGKDATRIARQLVEEHLAACVSAVPGVRSTYRWQDKIVADEEHLLLIKSTGAVLARLRERLLGMHPYDVPELLVLNPKDVPEAYARWLEASTG
jgi:periplasmic divalent cation tolerance protein